MVIIKNHAVFRISALLGQRADKAEAERTDTIMSEAVSEAKSAKMQDDGCLHFSF
jgi:hypothetical protein